MIQQKLEDIRRRLLDLTRNNRLLNHKQAGQRTLYIHDEIAETVYAQVVDEEATLQFLAREEAGKSQRLPDDASDLMGEPVAEAPPVPSSETSIPNAPAGQDSDGAKPDTDLPVFPAEPPSPDATVPEAVPIQPVSRMSAPDLLNVVVTKPVEPTPPPPKLAPIEKDAEGKAWHRDKSLQTLLKGEKLQSRLVKIAREANSALQEQGYNILFLTFGIIEWQEPGGKGPVCRAPLVFVPVELRRKNVQSRHAVKVFDDDILVNPCLMELADRQFGFKFPQFDAENSDLGPYFEQVRQTIATLPGWKFIPEINLGLFSFSKLLMYRDLDPASWPTDRAPATNPLIRRLSGDAVTLPDDARAVPDPATLDDTVSLLDSFQVVDADSSQQAAILASKQGISLVIEGPPGTGKSQTITNIIAECLAAGRSVLFVAEKSAALEVVQRRLEAIGLGQFVLEMHSRKASKRLVLDELQKTLASPPADKRVADASPADLDVTRKRLNAVARAIHAPVGGLKISTYDAIGRSIASLSAPEATASFEAVFTWTPEQVQQAEHQLETLEQRLARVGDHRTHPWRGVGDILLGLQTRQAIVASAQALAAAIQTSLETSSQLSQKLGAPAPITFASIEALHKNAAAVLGAPVLSRELLLDERWRTLAVELSAWIDRGIARQKLQAQWSPHLKPEAEQQDWLQLIVRRRTQSGSLARFVSPSWYADKRLIQSFATSASLPGVTDQVTLLERLTESMAIRRNIEADAARFTPLLGQLWSGVDSDFDAIRQYVDRASAAHRLALGGGVDVEAIVGLVKTASRDELLKATGNSIAALTNLSAAWEAWLSILATDDQQWLKEPWPGASLPAVKERVVSLPPLLEQLPDWLDLRQATQDIRGGPIDAFVRWVLSAEGDVARGKIVKTFQRHFYQLWVESALNADALLRGFRGEDHQTLIDRFKSLDLQWLDVSRKRLVSLVGQRRPDMDFSAPKASKLGILKAEMRKKARHMPLRRLLEQAGDVVQAIKPCFMMSPISVAQYLAPEGLQFDVVIFDEASQVEPADAFGAITRGRQVLLVGDEKQLPPTNFFAKTEEDDENAPDAVDGDDAVRAGDLESVLSLGVVQFPTSHQCSLRWHYRSRHASLIDFSNQKFYGGNLRVFPSPHTDRSQFGLTFRFIGGEYKRGAGRTNPAEALAVANAVLEHARTTPDLSLGIGTLNVPQQQLIEDEIERLRRASSDPAVERFFGMHENEPFFVKNLESIQGDERDVIYLSVGFGKDAAGKLTGNFGALNSEGGWRRLNVLVTRARQRCVVFSSMHAEDIDLGKTQSRGVAALKDYLYAAEHGALIDSPKAGDGHANGFEADIAAALAASGWEVRPQIGIAGYAIDLGIVDKKRPGMYVAGIECDGAAYHSSPTARDRDRGRQAVLERLGWTILRVWSTDWFHRREQVLKSLLAQLDRIQAASQAPKPPATVPAPAVQAPKVENEIPIAPPSEGESKPPRKTRDESSEPTVPYKRTLRDEKGDIEKLVKQSPAKTAQVIEKVIGEEWPIHVDEIRKAITWAYETRVTPRTTEAVDEALEVLLSEGRARRRGDFVWPPEETVPRIRLRDDDCPVTDPESIAREEYQAAIRHVLSKSFGLARADLPSGVWKLFGIPTLTDARRGATETALKPLLESGEVAEDKSGFLVLHKETQKKTAQ